MGKNKVVSILLATHNGEKFLEEQLESLLKQTYTGFTVYISDDCSTDGTWSILQDYSDRYPGLFKLNRNASNIMMFENTEKVWTMPKGDLVCGLAGDDGCGEGWFKTVLDFIDKNGIDYKNEDLCIYGDYKAVYLNGDSYIHKNDLVLSGLNPLKLGIRGLLGNRGAVFSVSLLHKFQKVSQGRSYIAEAAQDRQLQVFSEKNYYIPWIGNIYYSGIGVSSNMTGERKRTNLLRWDYLLSCLKMWGVELDSKDKSYVEYRKAKERGAVFNAFQHYLHSIDCSLQMRGLKLRRVLFAVLRRLPHNRPISNYIV